MAEAVTIVNVWFPSWMSSFIPVTVTVWATFQLPDVKVTLTGLTVPSPVSVEESPTVTFATGSDVNTIVNVAFPPPSVVSPDIALTVIPAVSSSTFTTVTSAGSFQL